MGIFFTRLIFFVCISVGLSQSAVSSIDLTRCGLHVSNDMLDVVRRT